MRQRIVGIIGFGQCEETTARVAEEVGEHLARHHVVDLDRGWWWWHGDGIAWSQKSR